jgi:hypothetical protein
MRKILEMMNNKAFDQWLVKSQGISVADFYALGQMQEYDGENNSFEIDLSRIYQTYQNEIRQEKDHEILNWLFTLPEKDIEDFYAQAKEEREKNTGESDLEKMYRIYQERAGVNNGN